MRKFPPPARYFDGWFPLPGKRTLMSGLVVAGAGIRSRGKLAWKGRLMARSATRTTGGRTSRRMGPGAAALQPYVRCACGTCGECIEDERWDRIFARFDRTSDPACNLHLRPTGGNAQARDGVVDPAFHPPVRAALPEGWAGVWARMTYE